MAEKGGMISRKECCQFSFTTQYNSFLSLVINYFMFFFIIEINMVGQCHILIMTPGHYW